MMSLASALRWSPREILRLPIGRRRRALAWLARKSELEHRASDEGRDRFTWGKSDFIDIWHPWMSAEERRRLAPPEEE